MFTRLSLIKPFIFVLSAAMVTLTVPAFAQDTGAKTSGTWENPGTWTTNAVPDSSNNVYIGSVYPVGEAANDATVTLTANESAANVNLGYGIANGTLDLDAGKLTITGSLNIGFYGGSGTVTEAGGSFTAGNVSVFTSGNSLTMGNADVTTLIDIENDGVLTTSAVGNITGGGAVANGATLNLGADMSLSTSTGLNVEGTGATLNLAGHNLSAPTLDLGYFLTSPVTFNRGSGTQGTLALHYLDLGNGQNLSLIAGDVINLDLSNPSNPLGGVNIDTGATLTTATTAKITTSVNVVDGTLNLGASLNIGNQTVNAANGSTVNLEGNDLTASYLLLGYDGTSTVTLNRGSGTPGNLILGNLFLGNNQNLTLIAGDTISSGSNGVNVTGGATLTTAATTNISNNVVNVTTGGTMNLHADLNLGSKNLNVQDSGSVFNAQGNAVTAGKVYFGFNGSAPVTVSNLGTVTASELHVGNGTSLTLNGGDVINSEIDLENGSVLTVRQSSDGTGLTLNGTLSSSLAIDPSSMSMMDLIFTAPVTAQDWAFRWQDPSDSTNWIGTLTTMINDQQINLTLPKGDTYSVVDSGGYTYVGVEAVPEPTCLVLMGLGFAGLGGAQVMRRRLFRLPNSDCV